MRILYARDSHSPSASLTLEEMGLSRNFFVHWSLRKSGVLRKVVYEFDPFAGNYRLRAVSPKKQKRLLSGLRFYIPPEADERAEMLYIREGTTIFTALLSVALFLAIVLFCLAVIPGLKELLDNLSLVMQEYFG